MTKKAIVIYKYDFIVKIKSKSNFIYNEIVEFENGQKGLIIRSAINEAEVIIFETKKNNLEIKIGDKAVLTGDALNIKISHKILGTVVSGQGEIIKRFNDLKSNDLKSENEKKSNIFQESKTIYSRDFINRFIETGTTIIDWAIPIGKGQRELIIGDRKTGKTAIALNIVLAQKNNNVKCIYVTVGQKQNEISEIISKIKENKMEDKVTIVNVSSQETPTMRYIAPYVGMTIAEYFQSQYGDDVVIIFDDLSKHAIAYREISLLLENPPARDAYPGDIFYIHSSLLERAGSFNNEYGGGTITAIPIVQTENNDISAFISTNIISMTDGQIFTSKEMFNSYQRPAINVPYSVSRIGSYAQSAIMKKYALKIKYIISRYAESKKMKDNYGFVSEINEKIIKQNNILSMLIKQKLNEVNAYDINTLLLILFKKNHLSFINENNLETINKIKQEIKNYLQDTRAGNKLSNILRSDKKDIDKKLLSIFIELEILPIVKFYLLIDNNNLEKNDEFKNIFGEIRNSTSLFNKHKNQEKVYEK